MRRRWSFCAVAVDETAGVGVAALDFAMRSHLVLGVMRAAIVEGEKREVWLEEMARGMVEKGRIGEDRAGRWLREVLAVVEPYVRMWEGVWPGTEERGEVLRRLLVENEQLFARWQLSPRLKEKEFSFELGAYTWNT